MKTISEIKKITIEMVGDHRYVMYFNDVQEDVQLEISADNLREAARSITRSAERLWDMFDAKDVAEHEDGEGE